MTTEIEWVIKSPETAEQDWKNQNITKLQMALVIHYAIKNLKKINEAKE